MNIYFAIKFTLREISFVVYLHVLMTQKSCTVGMRNAILRNHLNPARRALKCWRIWRKWRFWQNFAKMLANLAKTANLAKIVKFRQG